MSAGLMRGLTRRPATGSVVRWITVKTSTLAMSSSGMEKSARRRTNRSIEAPITEPESGRPVGRPLCRQDYFMDQSNMLKNPL